VGDALKMASTDGLMHILAACHCAIFIANLLFLLCTWQMIFFLPIGSSVFAGLTGVPSHTQAMCV